MSNRPGRVKSTHLNRATTRPGSDGTQRVAAKEADIKLFGNLIREQKRLSERANQDKHDITFESTHQGSAASMAVPPFTVNAVHVDSHIRHGVTAVMQKNLNTEPQVILRSAEHLEIVTPRASTEENSFTAKSKGVDTLVTVVQRIIDNYEKTAEPKQWLIRLKIDHQTNLDIAVEYLGRDEWRLVVRRDDQNESDENPWFGSTDEFITHLKTGLKAAQPSIQISINDVSSGSN